MVECNKRSVEASQVMKGASSDVTESCVFDSIDCIIGENVIKPDMSKRSSDKVVRKLIVGVGEIGNVSSNDSDK